jgi:hypothetical protein
VLVTCELCTPTRWFNTVLATSTPAIVTVSGRSVIIGCLVFWALSQTRSLIIASKHSLWFFTFALFCHGHLFVLAYVCVTNSLIGPINKR